MVMRKTTSPKSSPYSTTPASPPISQSHLDVNSADLPPIPTFKPGSPTHNRQSSYVEQDNPWGEHNEQSAQRNKPLPLITQAGAGSYTPNNPRTELPESPKAVEPENVTPRSSSESARSGNFWDDDEDEATAAPSSASQWQQENAEPDGPVDLHGASIKRKPVASPPGVATLEQPNYPPPPPPSFASNNPFRREASQEWTQQPEHNVWESAPTTDMAKGKGVVRDSVQPNGHQQNLMDNDSPISFPTLRMQALDHGQENQAWSQEIRQSSEDLPSHPAAPPPPVPDLTSTSSSHGHLGAGNEEEGSNDNPWGSEKASLPVTQPSRSPGESNEDLVQYDDDDLLDLGQESGVVPLENDLPASPIVNKTPDASQKHPRTGDHDVAPPLPEGRAQRLEEFYEPPDGRPPQKPPRPSVATAVSEEQIAKLQGQRNETYQIKHFNWFDHTTNRLRRSSMLTQNNNGPCPLLALVNALILGAKEGSQDTLDNALRSREQVSLGLIIETLMDELLNHGDTLGNLPDLDELNAFLIRLHTGMNANPRFALAEQQPNLMDARNSKLHLPQSVNTDRKMGTFEATQDIRLYSSFSIPLVHGWLPARADPARAAFNRSAQTYEDAQALMFGEEELEYKLSNGGLSKDEQQMWQDITSIKNFLKTYPTQLSQFGLDIINESLFPGSFAIMFRNDHFSTIYKHPETGQLFTLVTDAGYADRDEIVWESLVDVNGQDCEFFSGDFRHVGNNHNEAISAPAVGLRTSSQYLSPSAAAERPISPQEQQEQHDADFAMALQLQEEEEQEANRARRQGGRGRGSSEANLPIPIRSRQNGQEVRPMIPPRTSRTQTPAVNRPVEANGEEAPPLYEEAVKGQPYVPPVGSPHHPTADPSPRSSTSQLTGIISNNDPPPPLIDRAGPSAQPVQRRPQQRRSSAYSEMSQTLGGPGGYPQSRRQQSYGPTSPSWQAPDSGTRLRRGVQPVPKDDRECVVM